MLLKTIFYRRYLLALRKRGITSSTLTFEYLPPFPPAFPSNIRPSIYEKHKLFY